MDNNITYEEEIKLPARNIYVCSKCGKVIYSGSVCGECQTKAIKLDGPFYTQKDVDLAVDRFNRTFPVNTTVKKDPLNNATTDADAEALTKLKEKIANVQKSRKIQESGDSVTTGSDAYAGYRGDHVDVTKAEQAADQILETSYKESDAEGGRSELSGKIKETNLLEGFTAASRSAERSSVTRKLYSDTAFRGGIGNRHTLNSLQTELNAKIKQTTGKTLATSLSSNDVVKDFTYNKQVLNEYLIKAYRIDTSKMTYRQLQHAIKKDELKHIVGTASISLNTEKNANLKKALSLMSDYKRMEPQIMSLKAKGTSSVKNVASSMAETATTQGDFGDGLRAVKTGKRTIDGAMLVGKAAINGTIATGVHATNLGTRFVGKEAKNVREFKKFEKQQGNNIRKLIRQEKKGEIELNEIQQNVLGKYRELQGKKLDVIGKRNQFLYESRSAPVRYITGKGIDKGINAVTKGKITGMRDIKSRITSGISDKMLNKHTIVDGKKTTMQVKNGAGDMVPVRNALGKVLDRFNALKTAMLALKQKLADTALVKVVSAPFRAISALGQVKTALLLGIGGAFILLIIFGGVGSSVINSIGTVISVIPQVGTKEDREAKRNVQRTVNAMEDNRSARIQNLVACTSKYGTPIYKSWRLNDTNDSADTLNQSPIAYYKNDTLVGYDLEKYHGGAVVAYKSKVKVGTWQSGYWTYIYVTPTPAPTSVLTITPAETPPEPTLAPNVTATPTPTNTPTPSPTPAYVLQEVWVDGKWVYEYKDMVIYGPAGLSGDIGTYSSLSVTLDPTEGAWKKLLKKPNDGVFFTKKYYGSTDMFYDTASHESNFTVIKDDNTIVISPHSDYSIYKNILSMAYGFTKNHLEPYDYYYNYCQKTLDTLMGNAKISFSTSATVSYDKKVSWTYKDPATGKETECLAAGYDFYVYLDMIVDDCGIYNMMENEKMSNYEAHIGSEGLYAETDTQSEDYVYWDEWFTCWEDYIPGKEYLGKVIYKDFNEHADLTHMLLKLPDNEWDELFYNVSIPGKFK